MAKRVDPLKAKQAKQKKLAIGLCVLLAAVVAFQGPKMLKMMKGPAATAEAAPVTPAPATPGTVPDPAAPATPAVPAQEAVLADSDVAPDAESGQLISIDSFSTKDPFKQQLTEAVPSANPAPANDSAPPSTPATDTPSSGAPAGTFDPLGSNPQDQDPNAPPVSTTPSVEPSRHRGGDDDLDQRRDGERRGPGAVPGRRSRVRPRVARRRRQVCSDQRGRR